MLGLIGKKLGHARVFDGKGGMTAVTVVQAGPNRVLQVKTEETDGYNAVQLGFGDQKPQRLSRPVLGHLKRFGVATESASSSLSSSALRTSVSPCALCPCFCPIPGSFHNNIAQSHS